MKALVLMQGQKVDPIAEWMIEPFKTQKIGLKLQLNLSIDIHTVQSLTDIIEFLRVKQYDVAFIATSWKESIEDTLELFSTIAQLPIRPKIVYLDSFDQTSSPFFGILPHVDLYLKKQVLCDRSLYLKKHKTGYIYADFADNYYKLNMQDWHFGSLVDETYIDKIMPAWNLATAKKFTRLRRFDSLRWITKFSSRPIDIHCRMSLTRPEDKGLYYNIHRESIVSTLAPLSDQYKVISGAGKSARVQLKQYRYEMKNSKLAVSPFGWGEVTDRDYEIVLNETLLIKPDMSHLETEPNIYQPGKTYVPFKWDLSDLTTVCDYYLNHQQEAQKIAQEAKGEYLRWFKDKKFIQKIKTILAHLF